MALVANFSKKSDIDDLTFIYNNHYTTPITTSGTFTIGSNAGGMMFFNKQFSTMTVTQLYGSAQFYLVRSDGTLNNLGDYVGQLSDTPVNVDISDTIALVANGSIPGTGYTNYFTYSLS